MGKVILERIEIWRGKSPLMSKFPFFAFENQVWMEIDDLPHGIGFFAAIAEGINLPSDDSAEEVRRSIKFTTGSVRPRMIFNQPFQFR